MRRVSLQEFEAAHARIFKAMDANKDGQRSEDEMLATRSAPQQEDGSPSGTNPARE